MKYKLSAVSYINTLPFVEGLKSNLLSQYIDVSYDIPSICAEKLSSGTVDIGLVPVASLPEIENPRIISKYCIGAVDKVHTVCLFSEVLLEEIDYIILDYQSRTSVQLIKILAKYYWKIDVKFLQGEPGFENKIKGNVAGIIIGDRVFELESSFKYQFDLAEVWMDWKSVPFCFAVWVANKEIDPKFIEVFNSALKEGLDNLDLTISKYQPRFPHVNLNDYYKNKISYIFSDERRKSVDIFLNYLNKPTSEKNKIEGLFA